VSDSIHASNARERERADYFEAESLMRFDRGRFSLAIIQSLRPMDVCIILGHRVTNILRAATRATTKRIGEEARRFAA
jgi:hypothetical protein